MIYAWEDEYIQEQQETTFCYSDSQGCSVTLVVARHEFAQQVVIIVGLQGARAYWVGGHNGWTFCDCAGGWICQCSCSSLRACARSCHWWCCGSTGCILTWLQSLCPYWTWNSKPVLPFVSHGKVGVVKLTYYFLCDSMMTSRSLWLKSLKQWFRKSCKFHIS